MNPIRRAVVLRRSDTDTDEIDRLARIHGLGVVFTVYTDAARPRMGAMIAIHHILDHDAEVVVVAHLSDDEVADPRWQLVAEFADLVTSTSTVEFLT